jgi:mono/diheme cytochrome c family protein
MRGGARFAGWVLFLIAQSLSQLSQAQIAQAQVPQATDPSGALSTNPSPRAVLAQYCFTCHNQRLKTGGLVLEQMDLAHVAADAEVWEKVLRKLRSGLMPPSGAPRLNLQTRVSLAEWIETEIDRNSTLRLPPPGLHRLNRAEYANAIRDLLALEVDAGKFLPADDSTHGFDNIAGALGTSPALLEAYLSAAGKISRLAIGDVTAPTQTVYQVPEDTTQNDHVEGLPFGTRGGMLIRHEFPADGDYAFKVTTVKRGNMGNGRAFGDVAGEQLEILLDGERVGMFDWDKETASKPGSFFEPGTIDLRIPVKAGLHVVGVTFLATNYAPINDHNQQFLRSTIETGGIPGFTFYPHVGSVRISGPFNAKGATDTPSRRRIFVCRPHSQAGESACARQILSQLARRAYRRPVNGQDLEVLMSFYQEGRNQRNFDFGIQLALQRILAEPEFLFRKEREPANVEPGKPYRIGDLELASRLSFFLWSTIPDDELIHLANQGKLKDPAVLEKQVLRMLADARSDSLVVNFTGQWLNLRGLQSQAPVTMLFPDFDDNLRQAFRREVEMLFASVMREDRSIVDLLTADYTYVNERLARHYSIPHIYGGQFRRIHLGDEFDVRRGLLGKGALLTVSSQAGRTSPVQRGKWYLQTFLGVSPPDPPPNVPPLKPKESGLAGGNASREPTMRQMMEEHRANPACASCHRIMDPIGFSLENFNAIGAWRTEDGGNPIDASGALSDGTPLTGPASLRASLLNYKDQYIRTVTEKLLTYALGRGVEYFDMPVVRSIVREAARDNYRFSALVMGIVRSQPFQFSTKPLAGTTIAAGPGGVLAAGVPVAARGQRK